MIGKISYRRDKSINVTETVYNLSVCLAGGHGNLVFENEIIQAIKYQGIEIVDLLMGRNKNKIGYNQIRNVLEGLFQDRGNGCFYIPD